MLNRYWAYKNALSMDGLPAMQRGLEVAGREHIAPMKKMVGSHANHVKPRGIPSTVTIETLAVAAILFFCLGILFANCGARISGMLRYDYLHLYETMI